MYDTAVYGFNMTVCFQVYERELEDITEFKGLTDFCDTFRLQRGKNENGDDDPSVVGEFKVDTMNNTNRNTNSHFCKHLHEVFSCVLVFPRARSRCTLCQTTLVFLLRPASSESCRTVDLRSVWSGFTWSGPSTCSPKTITAK